MKNDLSCIEGSLRTAQKTLRIHSKISQLTLWEPIPVAARSKASVCGRSLAGIVGSNPARGMDVCVLWVLCVVR